MVVKIKIALAILLVGLLFSFCKKDNKTNQNVANNCVYSGAANTVVNFSILSGSAQYAPISVPTGTTYVNGYGYQNKGILIYRINTNQFVAFDRNCTHDGCTGNKASIWVQTGNTSVKDSTCGSSYNITDGSVITGPAVVSLYPYKTSWDGNQLLIYN